MDNLKTTDGPWIVQPGEASPEGIYLAKVVAVSPNDCIVVVALVPNLADAALMATSRDMLDTLIDIHNKLNKSKDVIDLTEINSAIELCFEKIAVEAGVV